MQSLEKNPVRYKRLCSLHHIEQRIINVNEGFLFDGHRHPGIYEILVGVKGCVGIALENRYYCLRENDVLVLSGKEFHIVWGIQTPAAYYCSFFEAELPALSALSKTFKVYSAENIACEPFWREPGNINEPIHETAMRNMLMLIVELAKQSPLGKLHDIPIRYSLKTTIENRLDTIINKSSAHMHSRSELAGIFCLEEHYLSNKIRKLTGFTLMQLYYAAKMRLACTMLHSGESVKNTAYNLGFTSPFHFSRKFKEIIGHPPSKEISG